MKNVTVIGAGTMGNGIAPDYSEAFKWYKLAADQGEAIAQSNTGFCYF